MRPQLLMQKKLEFDPSCCVAYTPNRNAENPTHNIIIGTFQNSIMVSQGAVPFRCPLRG